MISCRIHEKGLRLLLDDRSTFELPPEFVEAARVRPEPPVNNTCVFAVRVGGPVSIGMNDGSPVFYRTFQFDK